MLDRLNQRGKGDQRREVKHVWPGMRYAENIRLSSKLSADKYLDH